MSIVNWKSDLKVLLAWNSGDKEMENAKKYLRNMDDTERMPNIYLIRGLKDLEKTRKNNL